MIKSFFTYFLLLIFFYSCGIKQHIYLTSTKESYEIPFKILNNRIIVECYINGKPFDFIFDNGAPTSVISEAVAQELNLLSKGKKISADFNLSAKKEKIYDIDNFRINLLQAEKIKISSSNSRIFNGNKCLDFKANGILGMDFFKDFDFLKINFSDKKITLTNQMSINKNDFKFCNIDVGKSKKSFIEGTLNNKSFMATIDFGNPEAIITNTKYLPIKPDKVTKLIGASIKSLNSSKPKDTVYKFDGILKLGDFETNQSIYAYKKSFLTMSVNIGLPFFLSFQELIFDFKNQKLYYSNNRTDYKLEKYPYGIALQIKKDISSVYFLDVTSKAYQEGLRPGDKITSINGKQLSDNLSQAEICKLRSSTKGIDFFEIQTKDGVFSFGTK